MANRVEGPFIAIATFCEKVLEEKDGVLSLIRAVDRLIFNVQPRPGEQAPAQMPPIPINLVAVLSMKAGGAKGRHEITIRAETPSGQALPEVQAHVLFESEDRGVNIVSQVGFFAKEEGLYWFDVFLDKNKLLTRMPLRIVYQPIAGRPRPQPPQSLPPSAPPTS